MDESTSTKKPKRKSILNSDDSDSLELDSSDNDSTDEKSSKLDSGIDLNSSVDESLIQNLATRVNSSLKSDILMVGDQVEGDRNVPYWILTGIPALDYAIGGMCHPGLPGARIIEIHGSEATGKSTIALHILKRAIEQVKAIAYYQDAERVLTPEIIRGTQIDMKRVMREQPDTLEEVFDHQEAVLKELESINYPVVTVMDSIAACSTQSEIEGEMNSHTMGEHARLMSKGLRKIKSLITDNQVLSLWINQTREKIGGTTWTDNTATFAGKAMNFYASVRIRLVRVKTLKKDVPYGATIEATILKNKVAPPLRKAQYDILFVQDKFGSYPKLDVEGAILDWCKNNDLIGGGVGRYEVNGKSYFRDQARTILMEDPKTFNKFKNLAYSVKY